MKNRRKKRDREEKQVSEGERRTKKKNETSDVVSNRRKRVVYYHCGNRGLIMAVEPTRTQITSASISLTANCSRRQCASRRLICVIGMRSTWKKGGGNVVHACKCNAFGKLYVVVKMFTLFGRAPAGDVSHQSIRLIRTTGIVLAPEQLLIAFFYPL